ncbi:hypothetical protein CAEBREN_23083 [Caenorhabditis brenneri]|uniref:Uncharacterized protein n=1 Tax=Caenorhabditis brenneri TaxID=135651 RepID=G0N597_CAEBE|nr:hypothetical protein CAEBREN_23083 [Caenorhabditis brenneri]
MAKTRQQTRKRSLRNKASDTAAKKPTVSSKKTSGKPLVNKAPTSKKPVQKTSTSNRTVSSAPRNHPLKASAPIKSFPSTPKMPATRANPMATQSPRCQVQGSSSLKSPSIRPSAAPNAPQASSGIVSASSGSIAAVPPTVQNPHLDFTEWTICIIGDKLDWELDERMSTKKYAQWKHTAVKLDAVAFKRVINHPQAVYKMNRLKERNEFTLPVLLEFNAAYVDTTWGQRYKVTNVIVRDLKNRTVELVWELILRTELAALQERLAQEASQE